MIDDIIFNNADNNVQTQKGRLNVAIFSTEKNSYEISNFKSTLVNEDCGGLTSPIENPILTTPHTISRPDFDGDCIADLFLTVKDENDPSKKYYEIYIRRE